MISGFPSAENLHGNSDKLFMSIKSGDHAEVEKLLADRGHEVEIFPRIGCSPLHYSKFNLANWETENGDSPLILAARVDSQMVRIILKYGGNPNHTNKDRDTPLSIAAGKCNKEATDALLMAGANLRAAVVKLTSLLRYITSEEQLQGYSDLACNVRPLTMLLSDDVYLKCRCPIKAAFDVGRDIANIKNVRDEFEIEFELLLEDADRFAYRFLNNIDRMWEAKEILTFPVDLIRMAIDQKKKKFVSHPFSQQIINGRWSGELAHKMFFGKTVVALEFMFSPFFFLPLFLKFLLFDLCGGVPVLESSFGRLLRLKFTPCLCFITDAVNFIMFLAILICVCLLDQSHDQVTPWEYALYVCVVSRIFIELDNLVQQGWRRYFANVWNFVDILILSLLTLAAVYKIWIEGFIHPHKYEDNAVYEWAREVKFYRNFLNISYIYAVAEFILFLRLLTLLEVTKSMGPMLIALKYLLTDVLKFSVLLFTTVVGTSITIYSMSVRLEKIIANGTVADLCDALESNSSLYNKDDIVEILGDLTDNCSTYCAGEIVQPPSFENFPATVTSIMWSTFGLFDVANVAEPYDKSTIGFINVVLVLYILLSCVLLMNMLIGILSSTFDRIQKNCDLEWKYAKSELLKEYSSTQPFLIPFSTFILPIVYWFRRKLREEKLKETEKSSDRTEDQVERDKLISDVCERFKFDFADEEEGESASRPGSGTRPGTRNENFDARVRQKRRRFD